MKTSAHEKFLEMLGWEGDELKSFLPDWKRAAKLMGLSDKDVAFAVEQWIPAYWDLSLSGVKKFVAACIRGVVEVARGARYKAEGHSLIYMNMPSVPIPAYANVLAGGGRVHVFYPAYLMINVLTAVFNKYCNKTRAEDDPGSLRSPCANCALNRFRLQTCGSELMARPSVSWSWGLRCSEAPKIDEMMQCLCSSDAPNVYVVLPHDVPSGEVEADDRARVDLLAGKLRLAQSEVSGITGVTVTDADVRAAAEVYMQYMDKVQTLTDLVMNADCLPISGGELALFGLCVETCLCIDKSYVLDALDTIIAEVRERIDRGEGFGSRVAPRLACHFNPLCAPWLDKAFRDNGVCLVQGKLFPFADKFRSYLEQEEDVYKAVARIILSVPSVMNMLDEARINAELVTRYPVDGALYGFYSSDSWVGALQKTMVKVIEAETGVPHFYIEGNLWDLSGEAYETRLAIVRSICNYLKISNI